MGFQGQCSFIISELKTAWKHRRIKASQKLGCTKAPLLGVSRHCFVT